MGEFKLEEWTDTVEKEDKIDSIKLCINNTLEFTKAHEEKVNYFLFDKFYNIMYDFGVDNLKNYRALSKGEKTIYSYLFFEYVDESIEYQKFSPKVESEEDEIKRSKMVQVEDNYKTQLSSDHLYLERLTIEQKRKARFNIKKIGKDRMELIDNIFWSIIANGIEEEFIFINVYNIDFSKILNRLNKIQGFKNMTLSRLMLSFHVFMEYRNSKGLIEIPSDVLTSLFTSKYKVVLSMLSGYIDMKYKGIKYFRSARYEVSDEVELTRVHKLKNKTTIANFKKVELSRYKLTVEERKELKEKAVGVDTNVLRMMDVMDVAREYVMGDFKGAIIYDYKWLGDDVVDSNGVGIVGYNNEYIKHWEIFGGYFYEQVDNILKGDKFVLYKEYLNKYIASKSFSLILPTVEHDNLILNNI